MHPILRNILALLAGAVIGGIVNMALINVSPSIIPPPDGTDLKTFEGLVAAMPLMEPRHFIMPFLAHALGTLIGALIAGFLAASHKLILGLIIGGLFLIGGIMAVNMLPAPIWFNTLDLIFAYIPMGYLGGNIAARRVSAS